MKPVTFNLYQSLSRQLDLFNKLELDLNYSIWKQFNDFPINESFVSKELDDQYN